MPQPISFNRFHVYTLRRPLAPNSIIKFALVVTNDKFSNRRDQPVVSVLFLSPTPRTLETALRIKIECRTSGGTAHLPFDHYVMVDQLTPVPPNLLMETSGTEITEYEKREVNAKLRDYLDL